MEKDYRLLRPFDLEAAKRGENIAFIGVELEPREFIAGPDSNGTIIIKDDTGQFQSSVSYPYVMLPITWVEGRPVYNGDVLYYRNSKVSICVTGLNKHDGKGLNGQLIESCEGFTKDEDMWAPVDCWTWQKPKTKREGWINMYRNRHGLMPNVQLDNGKPFKSYYNAMQNGIHDDYIGAIKIEWEE
jgi:hypothetical protein